MVSGVGVLFSRDRMVTAGSWRGTAPLCGWTLVIQDPQGAVTSHFANVVPGRQEELLGHTARSGSWKLWCGDTPRAGGGLARTPGLKQLPPITCLCLDS